MDLSKPRYWNCFEIISAIRELQKNGYSKEIEEFFDIEKLKNTMEYFEEYQRALQQYNNNLLNRGVSEKIEELYVCGIRGCFNGKKIYSYGELKTKAKKLFQELSLSICSQKPLIT